MLACARADAICVRVHKLRRTPHAMRAGAHAQSTRQPSFHFSTHAAVRGLYEVIEQRKTFIAGCET
eukprot:6173588-Pleurochrysis_carterae.AAC.2